MSVKQNICSECGMMNEPHETICAYCFALIRHPERPAMARVESPAPGSDLVVDELCFVCWNEGIEAGVFKGFETLKKSGWKCALVYTRDYGVRRIEPCNVFKNFADAEADWKAVKRRQLEELKAMDL